jgi:hypothetical protein
MTGDNRNGKMPLSDAELEIMVKDLIKIVKKIDGIKYIKPQNPKFLEKLEAYQKSLPRGSDIGPLLDGISFRLRDYIEEKKQYRAKNFQPLINEFLESLRTKQRDYRIIENTLFRVGWFEMETQPVNGTIRILFDKNVILPWRPVHNLGEIESCFQECTNQLKDVEIPIDKFSNMLYQCYQRLRTEQEKKRKPNSRFVLLKSIHEEMLIELFRTQVKGKKNLNVKFKDIFFPEWAYQYNLERYRSQMSEIPDEKRLLFETGSQADTEKFGIVLNGLSAQSDYKKFCYIRGK